MSVTEVGRFVIGLQVEEMPSGLGALDGRLFDRLVGWARGRGVGPAGEGGLL